MRGARSFTPSAKRVVAAAFSRDRFGVNAGHCLRTRCFLRRPLFEGTAGRLGDRARPRPLLAASGFRGQGPSPSVSNVVRTSLPEEALGRIGSGAACGCRPLLIVPTRDARPLPCHDDAHSSRARRVSTWRRRALNPRSTGCASREPDAARRAPLSELLSAELNFRHRLSALYIGRARAVEAPSSEQRR